MPEINSGGSQQPEQQPRELRRIATTYLTPSNMPKEPQTFQFRAVRDTLTETYNRLLGRRTIYEKIFDPTTGQIVEQGIKTEPAGDPIVTEWGANRLISYAYVLINEQTPFANLSNDVIVGVFGKNFAKAINEDMYRNFEKYFHTKGDETTEDISLTNYSTTLRVFSMMLIQVMSRSVSGTESQSFYQGQSWRGFIPQVPQVS